MRGWVPSPGAVDAAKRPLQGWGAPSAMLTARLCRKLSTRRASVLQLYYLDVEVQSPSEQHNLENVMEKFTNKYREEINGTLSGFDRLVFRGSLRRLNFGHWDEKLQSRVAQGMEQYLCLNHILFKNYLDHVKRVSQNVEQASVKPFEKRGLPVQFWRDPGADKEQVARGFATERKVESGLICALSSMELSPSFEHRGTHIVSRLKPCQIVYQYQIHPQVGWMYARIQTSFPFNVQIGLNGREWLAHQMDREGLKYRQQGNCFVWIEDYPSAETDGAAVGDPLDRFAERLWRAVESPARKPLRALSDRLLLDVLSVRVGHRHCVR
jgi:hypothetical protein